MPANLLFDQVRRTSRNRIILAALVAAGALAVLASNAQYLRDAWRGPAAVTPLMLAEARSPQSLPRPWIKVRVAGLKETGIEEITVRTKRGVERGRSVSARYYAAEVGDRFMLVKVRGEVPLARDLVGEIKDMEPGVANSLFSGKQGPELRALFLPIELDTADYSQDANLLWWLTGLAMAGAALYAWIAWGRHSDPGSHPAVKRAAQWGKIGDVARDVEEEQPQAVKLGDWQLSHHYLMRKGMLTFDLHNLDELLWAYAEVTKKKVYYVIPAGQTNAVVLKWREHSVKIDAKEDVVLSALQQIAQTRPWIALGWNDAIEKMYNRQRGILAGQVAKARQQFMASRAPAAADPAEQPTQPMELSRT